MVELLVVVFSGRRSGLAGYIVRVLNPIAATRKGLPVSYPGAYPRSGRLGQSEPERNMNPNPGSLKHQVAGRCGPALKALDDHFEPAIARDDPACIRSAAVLSERT